MTESCATCRYFAPFSDRPEEGECVEDSPRLVLARIAPDGEHEYRSASPAVMADNWCGRWLEPSGAGRGVGR